MPKLEASLILDFDRPKDERRFIRKFAREQIVDELNSNGRINGTITWIEGWFIFGEDFPLDPRFGKTPFWRIIGYCHILGECCG